MFRMRLPATPPSIAELRGALRRWLEGFSVEAAEIFDVVLACSEALTLVIEDAPRQVALVVDVEATIEDDVLTLTTRDYGLWHESHLTPDEDPLGVALMRSLMDSVELERHEDGQTITLARRLTVTSAGRRALL